jgi:hypothetical protein
MHGAGDLVRHTPAYFITCNCLTVKTNAYHDVFYSPILKVMSSSPLLSKKFLPRPVSIHKTPRKECDLENAEIKTHLGPCARSTNRSLWSLLRTPLAVNGLVIEEPNPGSSLNREGRCVK